MTRFYLAIRDESIDIVKSRDFTMSVLRILLVWSGDQKFLPLSYVERLSTPIEVTAQYVTGASPDNGVAPRLTCSQGGVWGTISGPGCTCNPGFVASEDGTLCMGMGRYYWFVIV